MCLGALVSAGVPLEYLQSQLARLQLPETIRLEAHVICKNGIAATKVDVILPHETAGPAYSPPVRHLRDIEQIITGADLPTSTIANSLAIFRRLAIAEGTIHGIPPESVHFHEVGATDAIVDIVGTCLGLDWLGIDQIHCAPLPTGRGTVKAAHGRLPVPAPAVLKLMEMAQVPLYNAGLQGELVTPTGAAIATELARHFGEPPAMQLHKVGLGAGKHDLPLPNILRLWIGSAPIELANQASHSHQTAAGSNPNSSHPAGTRITHSHGEHSPARSPRETAEPSTDAEPSASTPATIAPSTTNMTNIVSSTVPVEEIEQRAGQETVVVLETQVDDLSPQAIGYLYDRLWSTGALDVFTQSVTMKKSRPGHLITVISYPKCADACEQQLLQETTTLGVRRTLQTRLRLRRQIILLETPLGTIRLKLAFEPGSTTPLKVHPEYEDCAAIAQRHGMPWREVHNLALMQWQQQCHKTASEYSTEQH